jgi:uncharacterized membrane protein
MSSNKKREDVLLEKLNKLLEKQEFLTRELEQLKKEISHESVSEPQKNEEADGFLSQTEAAKKEIEITVNETEEAFQSDDTTSSVTIEVVKSDSTSVEDGTPDWTKQSFNQRNQATGAKSSWEKFIGENLLNKIGIVITVIGVGIGAKYSIDNDLISPLVRIIMGYLSGLALLGVGIRLKKLYHNYSAVLVSGAMAILYFITYFAFSFYALFPLGVAFGLMLFLTIFTVYAAVKYNLQVIAHIGFVGAYGVPFLLSNGSGNTLVLFSYMSIINTGILVLAFRKYWEKLYYTSFSLSWLIYLFLYVFEFEVDHKLGVFALFLVVFFAIFHSMFMAYKVKENEKFKSVDILLVLANAFIFYGFGYILLSEHEVGKDFLGLFTIANALIHLGISGLLYKRKLKDSNFYYMILGLAVVFITISIPVQLDGNWVTLLWAGEAALLFWVGRTMNGGLYEKIALPIMALTLLSLTQDWDLAYDVFGDGNTLSRARPIFNITFLTSIIVIAVLGFVNWVNNSNKFESQLKNKQLAQVFSFALPVVLVALVYVAIRLEMDNYANQLYQQSKLGDLNINGNRDILRFKHIWAINFTLFYATVVSFISMKKHTNANFTMMNLVLNILVLLAFLVGGLYNISELRESYLTYYDGGNFEPTIMNLAIRYISFGFVGGLLFSMFKYTRLPILESSFRKTFGYLMHVTILWILSSEVIHWMDVAGSIESYGLGLSILWGSYSLLLVSLGIWKSKQELRIMGIVLFAVTLAKLFVYDIADLGTIAKTIVFISLGVLLLIISFLYNKYKHLIVDASSK